MKDKNGTPSGTSNATKIPVLKTYKLYIDGKFPRTESGRFIKITNGKNQLIANICRASRKDFRNAVVAARNAQKSWAARTAYNRGQILYRAAEMLESRKSQFIEELIEIGSKKAQAEKEVTLSIDRLIYYAGWADKYQQVFSAVNPVASSHFNFSVLEPQGVISVFAPEENGLIGLISSVIPAVCGGNTVVLLASPQYPTLSISFAEVLHTSDFPPGVINILTGFRDELTDHFSSHKDVNAMVYCGSDKDQITIIQKNAAINLKRIIKYNDTNWSSPEGQSPYYIKDVQEVKTTWHPIGC